MPWYKVADVSETNLPAIQKVSAGGKSICLVNLQGQYFATQLKCPHAGGDLSTGWCANGKLVCPLHRYSYDLLTGKGSQGQGDYINTYKVKIEQGEVFVEIEGWMHKLR